LEVVHRLSTDRLVALSVEEFVAKVASTEEPVPAGGSVAALTGACAAALLALASGVLRRRGNVADADALLEQAHGLQATLLTLVDEDAAAYHVFLEAKRDPAAIARMNEVPLRVAAACREVSALGEQVAAHISGAIAADVHAAGALAEAARAASLDLAEANISAVRDPVAQAQLTARIQALRGA
jgi:methenyltetrahydrofolate cyclohydrolase